MIKLVFVIHANENLGRDAAMRHWREIHAPIVARLPRLVRYVQKHAVRGINGTPDFLGIGELWFAEAADAEAALASHEMTEVVADGALFTAQDRAWRVWVEEYEFAGSAHP